MSSAAKVGAFSLVVLGILAFFVLKIEDVKVSRTGNHKKVSAVFDSVAGLDRQSAVRVARVRVGNVTKIDLRPDGKAEVDVETDKDVTLHCNAPAHVANSMSGTVNENRADVHRTIENLKSLSADLRTTSDNLGAITGQVRSGQGTVGKLLYSDETGNRLNTALASVESGVNELKNTLGRVGRLQLDLGMNSDYYAGLPQQRVGAENIGGSSRSAVWLRLTPNPAENNRFYNVEVADTPFGHQKEKLFETTTLDPATGKSSTVVTKETQFDQGFVVSAQAGWHLGALDARVGLFDSTGGAGVDWRWNRRI